jgi:hypothetical protein
MFRAALAVQRRVLGDEHPEVAFTRGGLGGALAAQDRLTEATDELMVALAIQESTIGPDHPDTAVTLYHLADVRLRDRQLADAAALIGRSIAISARQFGAAHPRVIAAMTLAATIAAARSRAA